MIEFNAEELEILDALDAGKLRRVKGTEAAIKAHRVIAESTFKKDSRINIRLASRDLRALQARALREGVPYQTLVASVLHKYVEGQLVNRITIRDT